jgi:predicted alpha/beta superfamily hydrolase
MESKCIRHAILFIITCISAIWAQVDSVTITFKVYCDKLTPQDSVFITGNQKLLGLWHPSKAALKYDENHWIGRYRFPRNTRLEYKITRGSWDSEALFTSNAIPPNFSLQAQNDTVINITVPMWKNEDTCFHQAGQITGNINYHRKIAAFGLKPRDLIVWLPPGYDDNIHKRYPVLYMHDGQNIFDPGTAMFGVDWRLDETADSLIKNNAIEPIIIAGIYNSSDRSAEYNDTDTTRAYIQLIIKHIKPLIDQTYRTKPEREFTATGGASSGGLISFILLWEKPDIFSKAACLSPAFKIGSIDYVEKVKKNFHLSDDFHLYIDNGDLGPEKKLQPGIDEMIETLKQINLLNDENFRWHLAHKHEHSEKFWGKRTEHFLKFFYPRLLD